MEMGSENIGRAFISCACRLETAVPTYGVRVGVEGVWVEEYLDGE